MPTLGGELGEQVGVHGVNHASGHYDATMEREDTEHAADEPAAPAVIEEELLIEEISIDGMCGVY
jgi:mycofactocin precursor